MNGEGEVTDFLRLPHFTKRRNAWRDEEREKKVSKGQEGGSIARSPLFLMKGDVQGWAVPPSTCRGFRLPLGQLSSVNLKPL